MPNELLFFIETIVVFSALLAVYAFFGREGMFAWTGVAVIIANIQVAETIELLSVGATLGNVVYASVFLATDVLSEKYGRRSAARAVAFGFAASAIAVVFMRLALLYKPAASDILHGNLQAVFAFAPRIFIASLLAYAVSNFIDLHLFHFLKRKFPGCLWLRNNVSTITAQAFDTAVFVFGAFFAVHPLADLLQILLSTFLFKVVAAVLDTPFLYIASHLRCPDRITPA